MNPLLDASSYLAHLHEDSNPSKLFSTSSDQLDS